MTTNKFYQPGDQRAARVEDLFATIAPRYDLINDLQSLGLHRRWKQTLVKMACVKPGEQALDVCCGTGDIALGLSAAGADVTGVDFSEGMLSIAANKAEHIREGSGSPPRFLKGDAMRLPFADESFDVVTIGYGLRNLADWETGLTEMWRVAKPGGRLLVLDFGKPDNSLWRRIYFAYLKLFVPLFGKIFCKDSDTHAYIYESLKNYPAQRGVEQKMRALNCRETVVRNFAGGAMSINFGKKSIPAV